jgi:hypothetical protein
MVTNMPLQMAANFWEFQSPGGLDELFANPQTLWAAACEYFEWCDDNPLFESKAFAFQGAIKIENMPKVLAYTMEGLCLYLGCTRAYLKAWGEKHDGANEANQAVIYRIEKTIYNQKFTAAAADLLNASFIARDLGLGENRETEIQPLIIMDFDSTDEQLAIDKV